MTKPMTPSATPTTSAASHGSITSAKPPVGLLDDVVEIGDGRLGRHVGEAVRHGSYGIADRRGIGQHAIVRIFALAGSQRDDRAES